MKCFTLFLLKLFFLGFLNQINCKQNSFIFGFLKDFVRHENIPTAISLFNCQPNLLTKISKITDLPVVSQPKTLLDTFIDPNARKNDILNILDLDCPSAKNILRHIHPILFAHPIRWILFTEFTSSEEHKELLQELPLRLDSNVIFAELANTSTLYLKNSKQKF